MIEQFPDCIAKCDVPDSQGKHYWDSYNYMNIWLAFVEHATNGKKDYREETPKQRTRIMQSNYTLAWDLHLEFIQLLSPLPESNMD